MWQGQKQSPELLAFYPVLQIAKKILGKENVSIWHVLILFCMKGRDDPWEVRLWPPDPALGPAKWPCLESKGRQEGVQPVDRASLRATNCISVSSPPYLMLKRYLSYTGKDLFLSTCKYWRNEGGNSCMARIPGSTHIHTPEAISS